MIPAATSGNGEIWGLTLTRPSGGKRGKNEKTQQKSSEKFRKKFFKKRLNSERGVV
jgi:hypothetical protein